MEAMSRLPTRISITGLAIVLFLNTASSAAAQADRGTITATVTDSSGAVVASASVKAIHVATNFERTRILPARHAGHDRLLQQGAGAAEAGPRAARLRRRARRSGLDTGFVQRAGQVILLRVVRGLSQQDRSRPHGREHSHGPDVQRRLLDLA